MFNFDNVILLETIVKHSSRLYQDKEPLIGHWSFVIGLPREIRQLADISLGSLVNSVIARDLPALPLVGSRLDEAKRNDCGNLFKLRMFNVELLIKN
jgi:hypothetical protein